MKLGWLAAGIVIGYFLFYHRKAVISGSTVKVGDKGSDIADLQRNINKFLQVDHVKDVGVYDKGTGKIASDLFAGTSGLVDPVKGELKQQFLKDFNIVFNRL